MKNLSKGNHKSMQRDVQRFRSNLATIAFHADRRIKNLVRLGRLDQAIDVMKRYEAIRRKLTREARISFACKFD